MTAPGWLCALLAAAAAWVLVEPAPGRLLGRRGVGPPRRSPGRGAAGVRGVPAARAGYVADWVSTQEGAVSGAASAGRRIVGAIGRRWRQRSLAARRRSEVIELCTSLGAELRAGAMPADALVTSIASVRGLCDEVGRVVALGGDAVSALQGAARQPGGEGLGRLAATWRVTELTGSGLADGCERVAAWLRDEETLRREVAAQLAGARSSARLMAVLPLFGLALGSGIGGDPVGFLLGTPYGLACLASGVALLLAGLWWTERLAGAVEARL